MNEAVAGTIALLNARGSVKREMRADVTMIASGRNNPLKFSPEAGLALRYLFGAPMPGFMEADEAMRDAYSDLRAHEFGFMAGLRAALSGVLKRFEPGALESRLPDKGGLNALLPMNRKAKLWELFSELYRQIATEAEEDFHNLFGREFLRAYEEHIAALERGQKRRQ
jgi:FHA domain-containing protein